ncbi:MAG TPA: hypothetical protein VHC22_24130 [Pirellulales bacterium]|nr:hypothetical protein [Pirellulales bacterium]
MTPIWLNTIPAHMIDSSTWEISLGNLGPAEVGGYCNLCDRHAKLKSGIECHHIVGREHLKWMGTVYSVASAPAVALPVDLHRTVSARMAAELRYLGGRPSSDLIDLDYRQLLELYYQVYCFHFESPALYAIARNVLQFGFRTPVSH